MSPRRSKTEIRVLDPNLTPLATQLIDELYLEPDWAAVSGGYLYVGLGIRPIALPEYIAVIEPLTGRSASNWCWSISARGC
jgi:hypothetical protein